MEHLTQDERLRIALEDFAWPDERKYPVRTQRELDSAARLLGEAPQDEQPRIKARAIRIARRKGFDIPESWKADAKMSADEMTTDDLHGALRDAINAKDPTRKAWIHDVFPLGQEVVYHDGNDLLRRSYSLLADGTVTLDGEPVKVRRKTVYEPLQIDSRYTFSQLFETEDAVVLDGPIFEAGDYPDKGVEVTQDDIQGIAANFSGVVPLKLEHVDTPLDEAFEGFGLTQVRASEDGRTLLGRIRIPKLLDQLLTKAMGEKPRKVSIFLSRDKRQIHELSLVRNPRVGNAAVQAAFAQYATAFTKQHPAQSGKEHKPMQSLKDKVKALFSKSTPEAIREAGLTEEEIDSAFSTPNVQAELERLKQSNTALAAAFAAEQATAFADAEIRANRFLELDRPMLEQAYRNALAADTQGAHRFSSTGGIVEGGEVGKLREQCAKRPAHMLTRNAAGGELVLLPTGTQFSEQERAARQRAAYFSSDPRTVEVLAGHHDRNRSGTLLPQAGGSK